MPRKKRFQTQWLKTAVIFSPCPGSVLAGARPPQASGRGTESSPACEGPASHRSHRACQPAAVQGQSRPNAEPSGRDSGATWQRARFRGALRSPISSDSAAAGRQPRVLRTSPRRAGTVAVSRQDSPAGRGLGGLSGACRSVGRRFLTREGVRCVHTPGDSDGTAEAGKAPASVKHAPAGVDKE